MNKTFLQFALLCDVVIKDEYTKKLSFIGLFDNVISHKLPMIQSKMYIVSRWSNISDELEHIQNFKIIRVEDDKEIYNSKKYETPFILKNEKQKHTVIIVITDISFEKIGDYKVIFFLDGEVQAQQIYFKVSIS